MIERDGLLVLDKPAGPTSHDIVAAARRLLGQRRVGHTGTLDPFATGVLPLLLGRATRLSSYLTSGEKQYTGTIRLGLATDTFDSQGAVTARGDPGPVTEDDLRRAVARLTGRIRQTPPVYSARKVGGRTMHSLARAGIAPPAVPVWVEVHRLDIIRFESPDIEFLAETSAGTYVRSIAHDLGQALGCGGHLLSLRRTRAAGLEIGQAATLSDLEAASRSGTLDRLIHPMDRIDLGLPSARVTSRGREAMRSGRPLGPSDIASGWPGEPTGPGAGGPDEVRVVDAGGELLGIASIVPDPEGGPGGLQPRVVLVR